MFGTILAVFDGYSRSFRKSYNCYKKESDDSRKSYVAIVCILAIGSILIIMQFGDKLKELVDFATTLSFLVAPIIAVLNHKLVIGKFLLKTLSLLYGLRAQYVWYCIFNRFCTIFHIYKIF